MSGGVREEWSGPLNDLLADFGEQVIWHAAASVSEQLLAIIDRGAESEQEEQDGTEVQLVGTLTVRAQDLPAGAALHDRVEIPARAGSATMETWVVIGRERDNRNGTIRYQIKKRSRRQYKGEGIERT